MEYKIKSLENVLNISGIVNLHLFEFSENITTTADRHPFCELIFINSGEICVAAESFSGTLKKDELLIHAQNELHSLSCDAGSAPEVIIIGFTCTPALPKVFSERPITLNDTDIKKLAEIVKEGRNVFTPPYNIPVYNMKKKNRQSFGAEQLLKNLLEYFLIGLIRKNNSKKKYLPQTSQRLAIQEIVAYADENYLEKITIDELVFLFRTNRSTLCREFKSATGKTFLTYIADKKLAAAKEQIAGSDKTFTQIASDLNFESIHYFTRFFKVQSGQSPKEFRSKN